eukprot:jgi/Mesen1/8708/ME000052S08140
MYPTRTRSFIKFSKGREGPVASHYHAKDSDLAAQVPRARNNSEAVKRCSGKDEGIQRYLLESANSSERAAQVGKNAALLTLPLMVASSLIPLAAQAAGSSNLMDVASFTQLATASPLFELADLDPASAKLISAILGPFFAGLNFLFIIRILPVNKLPYVIAYRPTEPVLGPTRRLIPPVGGVDVAPVIWVAIMSFINEILLGSQGLLVLLSQQQP